MKAAVVVQVSPTNLAKQRSDTETNFNAAATNRRQAVADFSDSQRSHSASLVPPTQTRLKSVSLSQVSTSTPITYVDFVDPNATKTAAAPIGEHTLTHEQAWNSFVLEENYSVLAAKGIIKMIAGYCHGHKSLQILKIQNAALDKVDQQNDDVHGMDAMEKAKEKKAKSKAPLFPPPAHRLGGNDDDFFSDEEAETTSAAQTQSATSSATVVRRMKARKRQDATSEFFNKMKMQMKRHLNELWKRDYPRVRFSGRCHLHYLHGDLLQRKKEYVSEVTLRNIGVRTAHVNLHVCGTSPVDSVFDLSFEPREFELHKGKKQVVKFTLVLHSSRAIVSEVVGVDIGWRVGSREAKQKDKCRLRFPRRLCVYVSAEGERAVFGVKLKQVEMVPWNGTVVPKVLVQLKQCLLDYKGLDQEGIFRKAPSDIETQKAKQALNAGTFCPSEFTNPHIYAHLIKVWFRELPEPVLQNTNSEELILCKKLPACKKIVEGMSRSMR